MNSKTMKKEKTSFNGASIICGADENDYSQVDAAIKENPSAIIFQEAASGLSALHVAAGDGNLEMVQYLLAIDGSDPSLKDKFNRDPLDLAIAIGHKGIVECLSKRLFPKSFASGEGPNDRSVVPLVPR